MTGQDYVALLRFPLPYGGLSYTKAKACPAFAGLLFSYGPLPYEISLSTVEYHTKKALNVVECFCFGVIQTGFEPVTHSLEGCCSIQLSYWTSPSFKLTLGEPFSKVRAKIVIFLVYAISFFKFPHSRRSSDIRFCLS